MGADLSGFDVGLAMLAAAPMLLLLAFYDWRMSATLMLILVNLGVGVVLRVFMLKEGLGVYAERPDLSTAEAVRIGFFVVFLSAVLMSIGYGIARRSAGGGDPRAYGSDTASISRVRVVLIALAIALLSGATVAYLVSVRGAGFALADPIGLLWELSRVRTYTVGDVARGNDAWISVLAALDLAVAGICMWLALAGRVGRQGPRTQLLWLAMGMVVIAALPGIFHGSRFGVVAAAVSTAIGYLVLGGVVRWRTTIAGTLVAGLAGVVVALQGRLRQSEVADIGISSAADLGELLEELLLIVATSGHFIAVDRIGYIAEYVLSGANEYPLAGSFLAIPLAFIPRRLWPEKPDMHEGMFVAEEIYGSYTGAGFPAGLIGGLLLNFGPLGLLGMALYGYAAGRLDEQASGARRSAAAFMRWIMLWWSVGMALLQSSITTGLVSALMHMGAGAIVWKAAGFKGFLWRAGGRGARLSVGARIRKMADGGEVGSRRIAESVFESRLGGAPWVAGRGGGRQLR